jgi:hypothetical protein
MRELEDLSTKVGTKMNVVHVGDKSGTTDNFLYQVFFGFYALHRADFETWVEDLGIINMNANPRRLSLDDVGWKRVYAKARDEIWQNIQVEDKFRSKEDWEYVYQLRHEPTTYLNDTAVETLFSILRIRAVVYMDSSDGQAPRKRASFHASKYNFNGGIPEKESMCIVQIPETLNFASIISNEIDTSDHGPSYA